MSRPPGQMGRETRCAPRPPGRRTQCTLHAPAQEPVAGVARGADKGRKRRAEALKEEIRGQRELERWKGV